MSMTALPTGKTSIPENINKIQRLLTEIDVIARGLINEGYEVTFIIDPERGAVTPKMEIKRVIEERWALEVGKGVTRNEA